MKALEVVKALFALLIALLIPGMAMARPLTINYTVDAVDCDGNAVAASEYSTIEFYLDTVSIPAADAGCVQDGATLDVPPPGAVQIVGAASAGSVTADVSPGTYFIRARILLGTEWSQLSAQVTKVIGEREPMVIILTL